MKRKLTFIAAFFSFLILAQANSMVSSTQDRSFTRKLPLVSCFGPHCDPIHMGNLKKEDDEDVKFFISEFIAKQKDNFFVHPLLTENISTLAWLNEFSTDFVKSVYPEKGTPDDVITKTVKEVQTELIYYNNQGIDIYSFQGKTGFDAKKMIDDIPGIVAIDRKQKLVMIIFHGSRTTNDWNTNNHWQILKESEIEDEIKGQLKFDLEQDFKRYLESEYHQEHTRSKKFYLHGGFLKKYLQAKRGLYDILENKSHINWNDETNGAWKIIVTGHSMGAALAQIAALDLVTDFANTHFASKGEKYNNTTKNHIMAWLLSAPTVFLRDDARDYFHSIVGKNNILRLNVHGDPIPVSNPRVLGGLYIPQVFESDRSHGYSKGTIDLLATKATKGAVQVGFLAMQDALITNYLAAKENKSHQKDLNVVTRHAYLHYGSVRKEQTAAFDSKLIYGDLEYLLENGSTFKSEINNKATVSAFGILLNAAFEDVSLVHKLITPIPSINDVFLNVHFSKKSMKEIKCFDNTDYIPSFKSYSERYKFISSYKDRELRIYFAWMTVLGSLNANGTADFFTKDAAYHALVDAGVDKKVINSFIDTIFPNSANYMDFEEIIKDENAGNITTEERINFVNNLVMYLTLFQRMPSEDIHNEQLLVGIKNLFLPSLFFFNTGTKIKTLKYFTEIRELDLSSIFDINLNDVTEEQIMDLEEVASFKNLKVLYLSSKWINLKKIRPDLYERIQKIKENSNSIFAIYIYKDSKNKTKEIDEL